MLYFVIYLKYLILIIIFLKTYLNKKLLTDVINIEFIYCINI